MYTIPILIGYSNQKYRWILKPYKRGIRCNLLQKQNLVFSLLYLLCNYKKPVTFKR